MQCCSFWSQHYDIAINYVGHAESWESMEIDSSLGTRDCPVSYKHEGRTIAFATISPDLQSLEVEAVMKTRKGLRMESSQQEDSSMSDANEREAFEAELAKVDERLREIERIEAELLKNIPHAGFRAASEEARLRSEKEMLNDTARKLKNGIASAKRGG